MTGAELVAWRDRLALSKSEASRRLGLSRNSLDSYEAGRAAIPLYIALACAAIAYGLPPIGTPTD